MKNAASYGVAKSIDVFAWLNRIIRDAIREEKHTKLAIAPFWMYD